MTRCESDVCFLSHSALALIVPGLRGPAAILFISLAIFVAIISQNYFVRVNFCGVSHNCRAICCKMGYRTGVPL